VDPTALFLSLIFSSVGVGFFIFGKKQGRPLPLLIGLALMIYPYFVANLTALVTIGVILILIPILARRLS
jgi:hypothetical protein